MAQIEIDLGCVICALLPDCPLSGEWEILTAKNYMSSTSSEVPRSNLFLEYGVSENWSATQRGVEAVESHCHD